MGGHHSRSPDVTHMNKNEFAKLLESKTKPQNPFKNPARRPGEDIAALLADPIVWAEPDPAGVEALLGAIRRESTSAWGVPEDVGMARNRADVNGTPVSALDDRRNGHARA